MSDTNTADRKPSKTYTSKGGIRMAATRVGEQSRGYGTRYAITADGRVVAEATSRGPSRWEIRRDGQRVSATGGFLGNLEQVLWSCVPHRPVQS